MTTLRLPFKLFQSRLHCWILVVNHYNHQTVIVAFSKDDIEFLVLIKISIRIYIVHLILVNSFQNRKINLHADYISECFLLLVRIIFTSTNRYILLIYSFPKMQHDTYVLSVVRKINIE